MRRPWNLVDTPVYSLATYQAGRVNMNICTYVTPISMQPKQYAVAVYYGTQTYKWLADSDACMLQFLSKEAAGLIRTLGKKSGVTYDKHHYLSQHNHLTHWQSHAVLKQANAYLLLDKISQTNTGGDHELFIFQVRKSKTSSEDNFLTFQDLINQGIIL